MKGERSLVGIGSLACGAHEYRICRAGWRARGELRLQIKFRVLLEAEVPLLDFFFFKMPLNEGDSVCCKDHLLYSKSFDESVSDRSHPKNTSTKATGVVPVQRLDTVAESDRH